MPAANAEAETEARVQWLGIQLATLHPPLHVTPARPCAECREWFVPTGDEPNGHRCMECERRHGQPDEGC